MNELEFILHFCKRLEKHARRKAQLYDGVRVAGENQRSNSPDIMLRFATEELGELAGAITRERWELAKAECLDVAHTAMLVALALHSRSRDDGMDLVNITQQVTQVENEDATS